MGVMEVIVSENKKKFVKNQRPATQEELNYFEEKRMKKSFKINLKKARIKKRKRQDNMK
jgi:hypothetical protein